MTGWILTIEPSRADFVLVVNDTPDPATQKWISGIQFLDKSQLAKLATELGTVTETVERLNDENNASDHGVDFIGEGDSPAH